MDTIIIGAGPAGFTAAIYAVRSGMSVLVFEKDMYGGQVTGSPEIENIPGIESVNGVTFAMNLYKQVKRLGVEVKQEAVEKVELDGNIKIVKTSKGKYEAKTVILANGLQRRLLNCTGEKEFKGKGVSYCATCDAAFYKGKEVFLVGGGSTALEDAIFLSNHCKRVTVVHRKDEFRAEKTYVDALLKKDNIETLFNSIVTEIKGSTKVESVVIESLETKQVTEHSADGIFIAIGYETNNDWIGGQLDLDENGYYVSDETCKTKLKGVFVAGDCRRKVLRQIVTASSDGAVAGIQAANYINTK